MEKTQVHSSALLTEISIQTLRLLARSLVLLSSLSSHPLVSVLATSSLLVLLYFPRPLLPLLFSPVLISTLLILATLLHFGSSPHPYDSPSRKTLNLEPLPQPTGAAGDDPVPLPPEPISETEPGFEGFHQKPGFSDALVEWGGWSGPLEVIYEHQCEGEDEEDDNDGNGDYPEYSRPPARTHLGSGRIGGFGFGCTDSDTESDDSTAAPPEWDLSENLYFRWQGEEEEEGRGLIEIELEEENLIEIDITSCR